MSFTCYSVARDPKKHKWETPGERHKEQVSMGEGREETQENKTDTRVKKHKK